MQLGLWALRLPSADSTVVQRTQTALTENPHGLPRVNERECRACEHQGALLVICEASPFRYEIRLKIIARFVSHDHTHCLLGELEQKQSGGSGEMASAQVSLLLQPRMVQEERAFRGGLVGQGYSDSSLASQKPDMEVVTRVMGPEIRYLTNPIVLLQCALVLLDERDNLPKGGVYTPGLVFGPTDLQKRLQDNGISFDFLSMRALSSQTLLHA